MRPVVFEPLSALYERFNAVESWEKEHLQECINDISAQFDINMGKIAQPLRVAVTGSGMSPPIDMTLMLLGKEKVLTRLAFALEQLKKIGYSFMKLKLSQFGFALTSCVAF